MARRIDPDKALPAALDAVADACRVCRHLQQDLGALEPSAKPDQSPVTIADWASQAVVVHRLREALGDSLVIGEEDARMLRADDRASDRARVVEAVRLVWPGAREEDVLEAIDLGGARPDPAREPSFWTLDPIDGTKGFIRGQQYAVALAWVERGEPTVGLLGCPNLSRDLSRDVATPDPHGTIYFASAGDGVFEVPADRHDSPPLHIRRLEPGDGEPLRICESLEARHGSRAAADRVLARIDRAEQPLRLDSQCKYAVVARGQADAFLRMPSTRGYVERIWDHAAGVVIASEAGCPVTDALGERLDFAHGVGLERNRGILCAPARVHGRILAAIEAAGHPQT